MNSHLEFEGDLQYVGTLVVDCQFRGTLSTEDMLIIGPKGHVSAEVIAGVVEISGKVTGNIRARNRVKIFSGGQVHGNIETPTISMEEGVVFEGNCTRPSRQVDPPAPPPPAKRK